MAVMVRYCEPTLIRSPTRRSLVKLVPVPVTVVFEVLRVPAPAAVKMRSRLKLNAVGAPTVSAAFNVSVLSSVIAATLR